MDDNAKQQTYTTKDGEIVHKHPGGRPRIWDTPEALQQAVDEYFDEPNPVKTVSGLCLAMDCTRQTLLNYAQKDEYFDIVSRAKRRIRAYYEEYGQTGRNGHFADRMLTRMLWPAIEQQEVRAQVSTFAELMAAVGVDDAGQPAIEGQEQRSLPETIDVLPERDLHSMQVAQNPDSEANNEGEAD